MATCMIASARNNGLPPTFAALNVSNATTSQSVIASPCAALAPRANARTATAQSLPLNNRERALFFVSARPSADRLAFRAPMALSLPMGFGDWHALVPICHCETAKVSTAAKLSMDPIGNIVQRKFGAFYAPGAHFASARRLLFDQLLLQRRIVDLHRRDRVDAYSDCERCCRNRARRKNRVLNRHVCSPRCSRTSLP